MKTVSAKYARQNFSEVLNEVYYGGEEILISRSGKPLVVLVNIKKYQNKKSGKGVLTPTQKNT